ncbi:MAG: glutathione peroxidase [Phycisphaerales bacterium]
MFDRLAAALLGTVSLITGFACAQSAPKSPELTARWKDASLTELKVKTLEGKDADLSEYAGKVVLVVNVASQCGYTRQYAGLQKIYDRYRDRGFVILGFPSGDFGGQEFDRAEEIREFCTTKYSVTFPLFEKCQVKPGKSQSEVFACLGTKTGELPGWNFGKYLVMPDGKTARFFATNVSPEASELIAAIEQALEQVPAEAAKPADKPEAKPTDPSSEPK